MFDTIMQKNWAISTRLGTLLSKMQGKHNTVQDRVNQLTTQKSR